MHNFTGWPSLDYNVTMHTEDDTFKALSKPDFEAMRALFKKQFFLRGDFDTIPEEAAFFESDFWTIDEYKDACWAERYGVLRDIAKQYPVNIKI